MKNILEELIALLSKDDRLVADGKLLKNKVVELALGMDADLIKLLLKNKDLKKHFFADIEGVLVFDKIKFQHFVSNKEFLPDSFTAFKNKIGLVNENGDYIAESKEVVLAWPYKDCVLEGGQTKEDQKRDEVFWNETLAPAEIDRLFAAKVFTEFTKYDEKGKHKVIELTDNDNYIIKGNNLLVLQSLLKKNIKAKLIYIDPPFNRDADVFYNDSFKHSTWLTFMKSRMECAQKMLKDDGCVFVHLDDSEVAYFKVLMDGIFGRNNYCNHIIISTNKPFGYKSTSDKLFKQAQHILFYTKDENVFQGIKKVFIETNYDIAYNMVFLDVNKPESKWKWDSINNVISKEMGFDTPREAILKIGKIGFQDKVASYALNHADVVFQTAAVSGGAYLKREKTIKKSKNDPNIIYRHPDDDMDYMFIRGRRVIFYKERIIKINGIDLPGELITDIWDDIAFEGLAHEGGVNFAKSKKPEQLIDRIIKLVTDDKSDLIVDFFLGSGTTTSVAHKLGYRYIGIEQMKYAEDDSIVRMQNVVKGDQSGISKECDWVGGRSIISCELMEWNESFIARIKKAKNNQELMDIWAVMKQKATISYKVDPKTIDSVSSDFEHLLLDDQKKFLIETLDKNQLYVNYSEIDDADYGVSEVDKKLNRMFYGDE